MRAPRVQRVTPLSLAMILLIACSGSDRSRTPSFLADLPALGLASTARDAAMQTLARDLEHWSTRVGRPSSAEALLGPMVWRGASFHPAPSAADTGVEAEYQRLELRVANLLRLDDSLSRSAHVVHGELQRWSSGEAIPSGTSTEQFRAPVFPPTIGDSASVAALTVRCALITITVLPSKEGVRICILKQKLCTRLPDNLWAVQCTQNCFDYIGWVPAGGGFTIGAK